jgi:radical SAM protein
MERGSKHGGAHPSNGTGGPRAMRRSYAEAPVVLTWELTQACALKCIHCRAEAQPFPHPDELDTDEAREVLRQVASFTPRPPVVVLSGGDPLSRSDVFELIAYGQELGLHMAVTPAPAPSLTDEVVASLEEAGVVRMALSLDGASAESHDTFRGQPGSFDVVRRAADAARRVGLPIQINTTVTRANASEMGYIADLVESMGAVAWELFFLVPVGRGSVLEPLGPRETEALLRWLYRRQRRASFKVVTVEAPFYRRIGREIATEDRSRGRAAGREGASAAELGSTGDGNGFVFISHTGEVFPSGFLPLAAGNVRDRSIVDLYRDSLLFQALRDPERLHGKCSICPFRIVCGGSRARAYAVSGDPLGEDPFCPFEPPGLRALADEEPSSGREPAPGRRADGRTRPDIVVAG